MSHLRTTVTASSWVARRIPSGAKNHPASRANHAVAGSLDHPTATFSAESSQLRSHRRRRRQLSISHRPMSSASSSLHRHFSFHQSTHPSIQQQRCYASASNEFWKGLSDAVQDGNALQAEEMVKALLMENGRNDDDKSDNVNGSSKGKKRAPIDTKLFSMVLQAWKNHSNTTRKTSNQATLSEAGLRATKLIEQMAFLANRGTLTAPPALEDYHAVLECWIQQTASPPWSTKADGDNHKNSDGKSTFHRIQSLLDLIPEPTTETMELALSVLANEGNHNEILQIIWELREKALDRKSSKRQTIQPTLNMYNSLVKAYAIEGTPELALILLEKMQEQSKKKDDERNRLPLPSPNGETYNLLISHYCAKPHPERIKQAEALLDQMRDYKIQRTASSYLPVITGLSKLAEAKRAEHLLARMIQDYQSQFDAELKLTLAPFRSVLWGYSKSYHPEAAEDAELLLNNILELNQNKVLEERPTTWSFNLVLKCWAKSKDVTAPRRSKQLYDRMGTHGIVPDSTSMNTVLNTWAKKANPINTEKLFWEFYDAYIQDPLHNPQPNIISFGTVLNALASKASRFPEAPDRAEALFQKLFELHQSGWDDCRPDAAAFSSLMQCWGKSKQPGAAEKAESILRKMQELAKEGGDPDMIPDTICWNSAIQAWALAGDGERAETLFREMLATYIRDKDDRQKPNIITFTAVLSAWAKTRFNRQATKRAESLLEQMEKLHVSGALDVKPNCVSYSIVMDCLAYAKKQSATERAEALLEQMKQSTDRDLQPNVVTYNAVIKAWSFVQDPRAVTKATSLLDELIQKSHENPRMAPNANTFGSVLKTIADSRHDDKASRADDIVALMEAHKIILNDWGKNQLKRCYESTTVAGAPKSKKIAMPDVPPLDYSS